MRPGTRQVHRQRVALRALAALALALAPDAGAIERIDVAVERVARDGWVAEGVQLSQALTGDGGFAVAVDRLEAPGGRYQLTGLRLRCPGIAPDAPVLHCRDDDVRVTLPRIGEQRLDVDARYDRDTADMRIAVDGIAAAGGRLRVIGQRDADGWRLTASASGLDTSGLAALAPLGLPPGWSVEGTLDAAITAVGRGAAMGSVSASVDWRALSFGAPSGLQAGQSLAGSLSIGATRQDAGWAAQTRLSTDGGQLYLDPVFTDFASHALTMDAAGTVATGGRVDVLDFRIEHGGVLSAQGDATLDAANPFEGRLHVADYRAEFPGAYETYLKPFLGGTAAGDLETDGTLTGSLTIAGGRLASARAAPGALDLADRGNRFALEGISGALAWTAADAAPPPDSHLQWRQGRIYGVAIGAADVPLALHGDDVAVTDAVRVPVLDGALALRTLAVRDIAGDERRATLDAELEPISLARLSAALGWPELGGRLSGRLPSLTYGEGVATLGGEFTADVFGGRITVADFTLRDPFAAVSELSADLRLDGLDLRALTETFEFGRITGTLDGSVEELRLLGWEPASLRAWFATPPDDSAPHRISQRAVQNLASLGGSGGATVLSRGFLQFFEEFTYDRIGIGCVLRENVCLMRGLAPANNEGYYIVRGSGLPRVDVIGYVNAVSWPTLVEQLRSVTAAGGPVIE